MFGLDGLVLLVLVCVDCCSVVLFGGWRSCLRGLFVGEFSWRSVRAVQLWSGVNWLFDLWD